MSQESSQWLNSNILSGMEATRGKPWWYLASLANPANHFDGPIPVERVLELFGFLFTKQPVFTLGKDGEPFEIPGFKAWVRDDQNTVGGIHSDGFEGHQFGQWLVEGPAKLVNGTTGFSSAGLLKKGAVAWVEVSTPEIWKTPQGVDFAPNLLCTTAFDGSIASTYKETFKETICDNTREIALNSKGLLYKVKHTKNSQFKLDDAKSAFKLLEESGNAFAQEIETLCQWQVTDAQYDKFISQLVPLPEKTGLDINKRDYSTRTATIAANKRAALNELYRLDGRVSPWEGTAFGVLQMVNTYNTHIASQRKATDGRAARNMENIVNGTIGSQDIDAMLLLAKICDRELVAA